MTSRWMSWENELLAPGTGTCCGFGGVGGVGTAGPSLRRMRTPFSSTMISWVAAPPSVLRLMRTPSSPIVISGAVEFFFFGLMRTPLSSTVMSTLRLLGTREVRVAMSQVNGGMLLRMPLTISSRIDRTKNRFQLMDTSHSP